MSIITEPKTYTGKELETVFFRPMLSGADAGKLGIRVLYNMPVPTSLNFWRGASNVLQKYAAGWSGGISAERFQKTIEMHKVKAEMGYSASDYFSMVYELITGRADVNMDDLSGTLLEEAETGLFKDSVAESIRATMWLGDTTRSGGMFNTFDGFIKRMMTDMYNDDEKMAVSTIADTDSGEAILKKVWDEAPTLLKEFKSRGELVFFVTSDVYSRYEESLDGASPEAAYMAKQECRTSLSYRGIPVVDMQISGYLPSVPDMPKSVALLTDRHNLAMAVNTADFPGTEVRMWYNPDAMENRQRAIFAAGCDYLLPELISLAIKE
jgi:hypothetical protein